MTKQAVKMNATANVMAFMYYQASLLDGCLFECCRFSSKCIRENREHELS
jgi:hypothetical protein